MLLPPPIVIALDGPAPSAWTSYVTPASTWRDVPVQIAFATSEGDAAALGSDDAELALLLDVASRAWSLPACTSARFSVAATRARDGSEEGNARNDVVVHRADWPAPLASGAAGHTVLYTLGGQIVEADIHLNARDFSFAIGARDGFVDLQSLLTHELGHALGVGHSGDARATMHAGLPSGIAARSLERDDREAACALYPGTSSVTCATTPCPAPLRCVGFTCERDGELGVDGAPCAPASEVRRCDGAGDSARCVATSVGERCARPCVVDADCGVGLRCVQLAAEDFVCLPEGASVAATDAGATPDASEATMPTSEGCTCATSAPARGASLLPALGAICLALGARRARRARGR